MFQFLKGLSPKTKRKLIGLILLMLIPPAAATYAVVHFSGLFALGAVWGWVLTFILWSWFGVVESKFTQPLMRKLIARWMMKEFED